MISFAWLPNFLANTTDFVVLPLSLIQCTVCVSVFAMPMFHTISKVALIVCSILHSFNAMSMLSVILPFSSILCTISGLVYSKSISFFVEPGSGVGISSLVLESTFAIGLIIPPLTIIARFILPNHQAFAKSHTSLPLSDIGCAWRIGVSTLDKGSILIELIIF